MNNYVSLEEDQLPAPVRQPTSSGATEFRPLLADITLYNDDKGKIMPQPIVKNVITASKGPQGMSFKEWKQKQEQDVLGSSFQTSIHEAPTNDVLTGVKKQVRFNNLSQQPQSLPIIKENAILSPVLETAKSLPPNLMQNPMEHRMELSICDTVMKQQQETQKHVRPVFAGLYQQRDATHLLKASPKENLMQSPVVVSPSPVNSCACQRHACVSPSRMVYQPPPVAISISPEAYRIQELRAENLERRVDSLHEQLHLLQQQISYLLSLQTHPSSNVSPIPVQKPQSSNPFLSQMLQEEDKKVEEKPQMVDTATQYTIIDPTPAPSSPPPRPKTPSDKTFFNQVLGQVNQILDNTDESNNNNFTDSRACKYIDSDSSAVSIYEKTPIMRNSTKLSNKKATDKSTVMDSLAAKYLNATNGNETQDDNTFRNSTAKSTGQETIDVSTTCYNYLKKYDLLKNYAEDDSEGNVLDQQLLKQRQIKFL